MPVWVWPGGLGARFAVFLGPRASAVSRVSQKTEPGQQAPVWLPAVTCRPAHSANLALTPALSCVNTVACAPPCRQEFARHASDHFPISARP